MNKRKLKITFYSTLFGAALIVLLTIIVLLNTENTNPGFDTFANASSSINGLATVNDFNDIIAKTSKIKINPLLLSLSGLEPSYNGMMIAQELLRNQISEFNNIADKTKASDIKSSNADKMLAITSNLESLKTTLSTKLSELKPAMKAKDIDKVEILLVEITETLNNTIEQIEKLNSAMVE